MDDTHTPARHEEAIPMMRREGKCSFFVKKKHRMCTANSSPLGGGDGEYCAIHRPDAAPRVPCPVDPKHDVKASDVARHVHKCRAAQQQRQRALSPFFREGAGIPISCNGAATSQSSSLKLRDLCSAEGTLFLDWVETQYHRLCSTTWWRPVEYTSSSALLKELEPYVAVGDTKHRLQQSVLCSLLLNTAARCIPLASVLEVGAGKGGVGCALKLARPAVAVTLVERASFSVHKENEVNKQLRRTQQEQQLATVGNQELPVTITPMQRVSLDAKDFDAAVWWAHEQQIRARPFDGNVPSTTPLCCGVVGKHLCGPCSDFTVRIAEAVAQHDFSPKRPRSDDNTATTTCAEAAPQHTRGGGACLVLATCCHHLCSFEWYAGRGCSLLDDVLLFPDARHFDLAKSICSWAIIGGDSSGGERHDDEVPITATESASGHVTDGEDHWMAHISRRRKIQLGRMVKALIDAGRVRALQTSGLFGCVTYVPYIDPSVSGECFAIVASLQS